MSVFVRRLITSCFLLPLCAATPDGPEGNNNHGKKTPRKTSETEKSHGSIFLRIGAIGFGLGTMIYNGLEFGSFLEKTSKSSSCVSTVIGINPILQATFTFAQMYLIFTYSRLMINKFKLLARLGLMHLVATNVCIWIRTLGKETLEEFHFLVNETYKDLQPTTNVVKEDACGQHNNVVGKFLSTVSPFLYPFIVEYSLIGSAFVYIMWCSIGRKESVKPVYPVSGNGSMVSPLVSPTGIQSTCARSVEDVGRDNISTASFSRVASSRVTSQGGHHGSNQSLYSCLGSSKGLFLGFLFLVGSITSLIIFFMMLRQPVYAKQATVISELSHSILLLFCSLATLIAFIKVRQLKFQPGLNDSPDSGLRDILLKVAAFGLYSYSFFGVIAGAMHVNSFQHLTVLVASTLTIVQVTLQSLFISDVVCRRRISFGEPGRQLITFLLMSNLTLWIIYTFQMQKIEASPVQLGIYGRITWTLIVRFTLPLSIFYRFHAAITFAEVWKNSYK